MACACEPIPPEYYIEYKFTGGGGKFIAGSHRNLGTAAGRRKTFPIEYLCYKKCVHDIVASGLYWNKGINHSGHVCIECGVELKWVESMNVNREHLKLSPNCKWQARRVRGHKMELLMHYTLPTSMYFEDRADGRYVTCLACNVAYPYFQSKDETQAMLKQEHDILSPKCYMATKVINITTDLLLCRDRCAFPLE